MNGAALTRIKIMSSSPPPQNHHLLTCSAALEKRPCVRETQAAQTRSLQRVSCRNLARRTYVVIVWELDVYCDNDNEEVRLS